MNQFEALACEEPSFNESELFHFQSLVADAKIALQDEHTQLELSKYPANVSLLAVSSKFGYYIAGTVQGFVHGSTEVLRNATRDLEKGAIGKVHDKIEVLVSSPVQHLRLTADETQIVVDAGIGEILIYGVKDIVEQGATVLPVKTFQLAGRVVDIRPNPDTLPGLAAVLLEGGQCQVIDLTTGDTVASIEGDDVTAICWSRKGKQLVCGRKSGKLEAYAADGTLKASIAPPDAMKAGSGGETENRYVLSVHWIDTHIFFCAYARPRKSSEDDHIHDAYIIDRKAESTTGIKYIKLEEVTPVFGMDEREAYMHIEVIRDFSTDMKNAVIVAHSAATDISVVGQDENGEWQVWALPENGLAGLPLSEETNMDTFPVGLALDFSTKETLPPFDEATSSERVKPMPVLMYLNDEDQIGAYYCYNSGIALRGETYVGMVQARDIREAGSTASTDAIEARQSQQQRKQQHEQQLLKSASVDATVSTPAISQHRDFANSPFGAAITHTTNEHSFAALLSGELTAPSSQPTGEAFNGTGLGGFGSFKTLSFNSNAKVPANNLNVFNGDKTTSFGSPSFGSPSFGSSSFGSPSFGSPSFGETGFGVKPTSGTMASSSFADLAKTTQKSIPSITSFGGFPNSNSSGTSSFGRSNFGSTPEAPNYDKGLASTGGQSQGEGRQSISNATGILDGGKGSAGFGSKSEAKPVKPSTTDEVPERPRDGNITGEAKRETDEVVPNTEHPPVSSSPSTNITMKSQEDELPSSTGIELGGISESLNAIQSPRGAPTQLAAKLTVAPETEPCEHRPNNVDSLSLAELGNTAQPLSKTSDAGAGSGLFGGDNSVLTPISGRTSFESTAKVAFGTTSSGLSNLSPAPTTISLLTKSPTLSPGNDKAISEQDRKHVEKPASPFAVQSTGPKGSPIMSSLSKPVTSLDSNLKTALRTEASASAATATASSPVKKQVVSDISVSRTEAPSLKTPMPKPSIEESMATEFEALYFMMSNSLKKATSRILAQLDGKQEDLKRKIDAYQTQRLAAKTSHDLDLESSWNLGDVDELSVITDQMTARAQELRREAIRSQHSMGYFDGDIIKLKAKDATIEELLKSDSSTKIKKELGDRKLSEEALLKWKQLKSRSAFYGEQLDILESKLQDFKKKLRAKKSGGGFYTLYGLYAQLHEIEKELKIKETTVKDLEDHFAFAHFKAIHEQVRLSASGIGPYDEKKDENVYACHGQLMGEVMRSNKKEIRSEAPWPHSLVESTARHLRREQFLDRIWQFQSQKAR
ncbi:hypothetical protein BX666DRAFT_2029509 [Dichotomocladium elegans]|nr:hypothetical protein BX666DRAFT_2029509 [Dichotomocladium elegans]